MDLRPPENYIVHVYMWPWLGLNSCDYPGPCFHIMRTKPLISLLIKGVMWGGGGGWDGDITILEIICRCVDIFSAIRFGGGGGGVYTCTEKKFIWEKNLQGPRIWRYLLTYLLYTDRIGDVFWNRSTRKSNCHAPMQRPSNENK